MPLNPAWLTEDVFVCFRLSHFVCCSCVGSVLFRICLLQLFIWNATLHKWLDDDEAEDDDDGDDEDDDDDDDEDEEKEKEEE